VSLKPPAGFVLDRPDTTPKPPEGFTLDTPQLPRPTQAAPATPQKSGMVRRVVGDSALDVGKGIIDAGEAAVGLADLATGGLAGKGMDAIGFRPDDARQALSDLYSPERQQANQVVNDAHGFLPTLKAMVQNPSTIAGSVLESAPSTVGGGGIARGLAEKALPFIGKIAPVIAAGIGEGAVQAGQSAEQSRRTNADGMLTAKQAIGAVGSGALDALISAFGGATAQKLGIADIDTLLAGGKVSPNAKPANILKRALEGVVQEGLLEELPQSAQEQMWQNYATGQPLMQGVPEAAAQGAITGAAQGGATAAALPGHQASPTPQPEQNAPPTAEQPAAPTQAAPAPAESQPMANPTTPGPLTRVRNALAEVPFPGAQPGDLAHAANTLAAQGNVDTSTGEYTPPTDEAIKASMHAAMEQQIASAGRISRRSLRDALPDIEAKRFNPLLDQVIAERKQGITSAQYGEASDGRGSLADAAASGVESGGDLFANSAGPNQPGPTVPADAGLAQAAEGDTGHRDDSGQPERALADEAAPARAEGLTAEEYRAAGEAAQAKQQADFDANQRRILLSALNHTEDALAGTNLTETARQRLSDNHERLLGELYDTSGEAQDADIMPPSGSPYSIRDAAEREAARHEGGRVFPVEGGFVVRVPQAASSDQRAAAPSAPATSAAGTPAPAVAAPAPVQGREAPVQPQSAPSASVTPSETPEETNRAPKAAAAPQAAAPLPVESDGSRAAETLAAASQSAEPSGRGASPSPVGQASVSTPEAPKAHATAGEGAAQATGNTETPAAFSQADYDRIAAKPAHQRTDAEIAAANAFSREKARPAKEAAAAAEKAKQDALNDIDGFADNLPPMQRQKKIDALNKQVVVQGNLITRKQHVRDMVARGSRVGMTKEGRALLHKSGSYTLEKDLSKTALDYAEHLTKQAEAQPTTHSKEQGENTKEAFAKLQQRIADREAQAKALAAKGESVAFKHADGREALAGPDMSKPGRFRTTHFRDGEPTGHMEFPSLEAAVHETLRNGFTPAEAVHTEGGKSEPATPAAIAESAQKASRAPAVTMAEARKDLLTQIDRALATAPPEGDAGSADNPHTTRTHSGRRRAGNEWEVRIDRTLPGGLATPALKIEQTPSGQTFAIYHQGHLLGSAESLLGARLTAGRLLLGAEFDTSGKGPTGKWTFKEVESAPMVTFDVKGDGTFKVRNTQERLQQFRKQVEQQFKNRPNSSIRDLPDYTPTPRLTASEAERAKIMAEAETVESTPTAGTEAAASAASQPTTQSSALTPDAMDQRVRTLSQGLERIGWQLTNVDIDVSAETARIELRSGQRRVMFDVRNGRGSIERDHLEEKQVPVGRKGDRFVARRLEPVFMGRTRVSGLRSGLRALSDYIVDNASVAITHEQARDLFRPLLGGAPVRAALEHDNVIEGQATRVLPAAAEKAASQPTSDESRITEKQARERLAWRSLGTEGHVATHALFFKDGDGRDMKYGTVERYEGGKWNVIGDDDSTGFAGLADAKKRAEQVALDRLARDGYVEKATAQAASQPTKEGAKATPEPAAKIEDFGERLEGARKFLPPSLRDELGDEDIATLPLSKVWPSDAHESIENPVAAALAFAARQEIPAKPRKTYRVKQWVEKVKGYRAMVRDLGEKSLDDLEALADRKGFDSLAREFFPKVRLLAQLPREAWGRVEKAGEYPDAKKFKSEEELKAEGIVHYFPEGKRWLGDYYRIDPKTGERNELPLMGDERSALYKPNPYSSATIDGKSRDFPVGRLGPDEVQQVKNLLAGEAPKKEGLAPSDFEIRVPRGSKTAFINRKGDAEYRKLKIFVGDDAVAQARAYLKDHLPEVEQAWEETKARDNVGKGDMRRDENRERVGENRRNGKDVTPEMFEKAFGFRGVQFGNWVAQGKGAKDRIGLLNDSYDALLDLADLLGIPSQAISLEGTLGLSLGARGHGKNAAHFEPSNLVINLTKTRGAGSLAHEWFHALDNYFARKRGGEVPFKGDQAHYRQNNYITYKPEPMLVSKKGFGTMTRDEVLRRQAQHPTSAAYQLENWEPSPNHKEGVRPVVEKAFADLVAALNASPMAQRAASIDGVKVRGGQIVTDGYWSRIIERGARSFENYVISKMAQRGWSNDFLANIRDWNQWHALGKNDDRYPYLKPEEEAPIVEAFDKLFDTIQPRTTEKGVALENTDQPEVDENAQPTREEMASLMGQKDHVEGNKALRDLAAQQSREEGEADAEKYGLRKAVNRLLGPAGVRVQFLRNMDGLPEDMRSDLQSRNEGRSVQTAALYDPASGTAYVFTDRVKDPVRAAWHAAHEIAGHDGLRKLLGPNLDKALTLAGTNPTVKAVADAIAAERNLAPTQNLLATEEALAELAAAVRTGDYGQIESRYGVPVPQGIREKVVAAINEFLRRLKNLLNRQFGKDVFTDQDVRSLLEHAWQTAQEEGTSAGEAVESTTPKAEPVRRGDVFQYGNDPNRHATVMETFPGGRVMLRVEGMRNGKPSIRIAEARASEIKGWKRLGKAEFQDGSILPFTPASTESAKPLESTEPLTRRASEAPADVLADVEAVMTAGQDRTLLQQAKDKLASLVPSKVKDETRHVWLAGLSTDMLAELGSDYNGNMTHYAAFLKAMNADRNELQQDGDTLAEAVRQWGSKHTAEAKDLFKLMHQATIDGVDPAKEYQPLQFRYSGKLHEVNAKNIKEALAALRQQMRERSGDSKKDMLDEAKKLRAMKNAEPRRKAQYPTLKAKWDALTPEAQGFYTQMRDMYQARSKMVEDGLVARIEDTDAPENQKRKLITVIRQQFETQRLQGVYFPLQRFGQYFVAADRSDGSTFVMYESQAKLEAGVKALKERGFTITAQGLKSQGRASDAPSGTFVAEVIDLLKKAHVAESTQDEIYQAYLQSLPELSLRKHAIHRKAVPGFDPDAVRGFAFNMLHGAHQIARLRYAHKLANTITLLRQQQDAARKEPEADTKRIVAFDAILNELDKRHQWIMNPTDSKATGLISSAGFIYYLGITPAAAMVNLTQTALLTFPYLAARHGPVRAMNHLLTGMRDTARTFGHIQKVLTNADELAMHAELIRRGLLDKTQAHNLAGIAEGGLAGHNPQWAKAMSIIGMPFHKAEVFNREASGIAAYRLSREDSKAKGVPDKEAHERGIDAAARAINDTHFDYTNQNRARIMQSGTAKTLLMFRQYSLNMTWHLARMLWQATKNADPAVKKIARRNLAGVLGMSALFSGTLGLPLMSVTFGVLNAIAASFGDPDQPWDAETEFKQFLDDMFGKGAGEIMANGPINTLTGADIASRVSLSQLWFRDADRELDGKGAYYNLLEQAAGPMGGVLKNVLVGKQLIDQGHTMRGVETMLPKALKDTLKAQRYAAEGVNNLRSDPLVPDVSLRQTLLQLAGFTPDQVAQQYDVNRDLKNYEQAILDRRAYLIDAFAMALRTEDDDARTEVLDRIRHFNQTNPEIAITTKGLRNSIGARARYSQDAENGIVLNRRLAAKVHQETGE